MLDAIRNAYTLLEQLNISVTGLIVIMVILSLAFLFAIREAAAWFFKIDDLKRDINALREISTQMETEIHALQTLIAQARTQAQLNVVLASGSQEPGANPSAQSGASPGSASSKAAKTSFPFMH